MAAKPAPSLAGIVRRKAEPEPQPKAEDAPEPERTAPDEEERVPKLTRVGVYLTPQLYKRLRIHAFEVDMTHQDLLEAAIRRYLDAEEKSG